MSNRPTLPDLSKLSSDQKDELIVRLWDTLVATEAAWDVPNRGGAESQARVGATSARGGARSAGYRARSSPRARAGTPIRLGRGLSLFNPRIMLCVLLMIVFGLLVDFGIGRYQRRALEDRKHAILALENAALGRLFVELIRIGYEPDGQSYRATLAMRNSDPDYPIYIMLNPVRVFMQAGLSWREMPSQVPNGTSRGVVKLDGTQEFQVLFQAEAKDWTELIPGYMHVRVENDMLISRRSEPKDDIVERSNRFYVYLKPQGMDDAAIRRRSNFSGDPPIFIPMPPH
jgi:hypothetical protein